MKKKKRWFIFNDGKDIIVGYEKKDIEIYYREGESTCIFHGIAVYDTRKFVWIENNCPHPIHFDSMKHIKFITELQAFIEMI